MSGKIEMPIYRAIDNHGISTEGHMVADRDNTYIINVRFLPSGSLPMNNFKQIDPLTLEISFDGGLCFYKIDTIAHFVKSEFDDDYMVDQWHLNK